MKKLVPVLSHWLAGALLLTTAGAAQAQTTFSYTGANQTYTVPAGITSIQVDAIGATGGVYTTASTNYAYGARVRATLKVTPGEVLTVVVGGRGLTAATPAGGFNGGGSGFGNYSGGGGGATDLRRTGTSTGDYLTSRNALLVAGGGGGADDNYTNGGTGGTPTGGNATSITVGSTTATPVAGSGATQTGPGGGSAPGMNNVGGTAQVDGGGGGGGYYGGAGGVGVSGSSYGGGGGGSSWVMATGTSVTYALATAASNGSLVITPGPLGTQGAGLLADAQASLYPNPAGSATAVALTVTGLPAGARQVQATLCDVLGRPVGQVQVAIGQGAGRAQLPTPELAVGMYMLQLTVQDAQGQVIGTLPTQRLSVR